jgi:hypothetical protein
MASDPTIEESNKRLYNPYTDSHMEVLKKRRLNNGIENIVPSPGLIGPPQVEAVPWPGPPLSLSEIQLLAAEAKQAELERQQRINRATYESVQIGAKREVVKSTS